MRLLVVCTAETQYHWYKHNDICVSGFGSRRSDTNGILPQTTRTHRKRQASLSEETATQERGGPSQETGQPRSMPMVARSTQHPEKQAHSQQR